MKARAVLSIGAVLLAVIALVTFILLLVDQHWQPARSWAPKVVAALKLTPCMVWPGGERFLASSLVVVWFAVCALLVAAHVWDGVLRALAGSHELFASFLALTMAAVLLDKRRRMLAEVQNGVSEDKARYDAAYDQTVRDAGNEEALVDLLQFVKELAMGNSRRTIQTV
eukprot:2634054-Rhodomonas_salina.1